MSDSAITVNPTGNYTSFNSFIYHSSSSNGTCHFYQPTNITNEASYNVSFGFPPSASIGMNFNHNTNVTVSGGQYTPVNALGIPVVTEDTVYYEGANQFGQYSSSFNHGTSYTVQVYSGDFPYATANASRYLSGS
jgi:hypothetical protein